MKKINILWLFLFLFPISLLGNENFFKAVASGDLKQIQVYIEQGGNINILDEQKRNALQIALANKKYKVIDILLDSGIEILNKDSEGKTCLEYLAKVETWSYLEKALEKVKNLYIRNEQNYSIAGICTLEKNLRCLEFLLNKGFSVNSREGKENLPLLHLAYINNLDTIVKFFLEKGANPNEVDSFGNSLFHLIAERGDLKTLSRFDFPFLDQKNENWDTPLHIALEKSHVKLGLELLNMNASPSLPNKNGVTAFHLASKLKSSELVKKIIPKVFDIDDRDNQADTPLIYAIEANQVENVKTLLKAGSNPNLEGSKKLPPLALAIEKNNFIISKTLLEFEANANIFLPNGKHLSFIPIENNNLELFKLLINKLEVNKIFLLHYTAKLGKISFIKLLLERGADLERLNKEGDTPLFEAVQEGNQDAVLFLLKNKANINAQNFLGESLLHRAILFKRIGILEILLKEGVALNLVDRNGNNLILQVVYLREKNFSIEYLLNIIQILTNYGVKINARNYFKETSISIAIKLEDPDLILGLLENGADINILHADGSLLVEKLVEIYLNKVNKDEKFLSLIHTVFKRYANINLYNSNKRDILSEVLKNYNLYKIARVEELISLFLEIGIKLNHQDIDGKSTFNYARNTENKKIIELVEGQIKSEPKSLDSVEWSNIQYGTSASDEALALDSYKNGNHLLLGLFTDETKLFLLNSKGRALWQINYQNAQSAAFDSSGNIFLSGTSLSTNLELINKCESREYSIPFLVKLNQVGIELEKIEFTKQGLCGTVESIHLYFVESGFYLVLNSENLINIHFISLDLKIKWSKTIFETLKDVKLSLEKSLYLITSSIYIFEINGKVKFIDKKNNYKLIDLIYTKSGNVYSVYEEEIGNGFWLIKQNQKGKEIWNRFISSDRSDKIKQIQLDSLENIYIIGITNGQMHGSKKVSEERDDDIFLIKYDLNGKRLWTVQFGSDGDDQIKSFHITQEYSTFVLASSRGKIKGGTFQGGEDITVFKVTQDGETF